MRIATRLVLAAALMAATLVGTANAQVLDRMTFKTNFPFVVGNTTLPAGGYTVSPVDDDTNVLELSDGKVSVLLETEGARPSRTPPKSEVTFNKYGDTYVLREIWDAEAQSGALMVRSHAEKRHEKAHGKPTQEGVPATKSPKVKS